MSAGAIEREAGFDELLAEDGEDLTYGRAASGTTVEAIVDRGGPITPKDRMRLEFEARSASTIEFQKTEVASDPKSGDNLEDEDGHHHRVETVKATDFTWVLSCDVEEPD
jgi:hypothetical protein